MSMNRIRYGLSARKQERMGERTAQQRGVNAFESRTTMTNLRPTVETSAGKKNAIKGHGKMCALKVKRR